MRARRPDPQPDDAQLIQRIAAGDERALVILYDRYGAQVYGLALRLTGERPEAEEVVQDVFLRLWLHARHYDGERAALRTWLLAMTRHRAIDLLRSRRRRPAAAALAVDVSDGDDVAAGVEQALLHADVARALARLPEPLRELIERSYYRGESHRQIAAQLGLPVGTVKTRLRQAVERLRQLMRTGEEALGE